MSDPASPLPPGASTNPSFESISRLVSVIAACPNCQFLTFDASWKWKPLTYKVFGSLDPIEFYQPAEDSTRRPFDTSGELCAEHWLMLSAMASSSATSQP